MDWSFLSSNRFWALILGAGATVFLSPDFSTQPWYHHLGDFLGIVSAGFITIRTIDRASERIGKK